MNVFVCLHLSTVIDNQHDIDRLDTLALLIDTGVVYEAPFATITPKLHLESVFLGNAGYKDEVSGSAVLILGLRLIPLAPARPYVDVFARWLRRTKQKISLLNQ